MDFALEEIKVNLVWQLSNYAICRINGELFWVKRHLLERLGQKNSYCRSGRLSFIFQTVDSSSMEFFFAITFLSYLILMKIWKLLRILHKNLTLKSYKIFLFTFGCFFFARNGKFRVCILLEVWVNRDIVNIVNLVLYLLRLFNRPS
jgi:hypothetical protein